MVEVSRVTVKCLSILDILVPEGKYEWIHFRILERAGQLLVLS